MPLLPLILFESDKSANSFLGLPPGCIAFGAGANLIRVDSWIRIWKQATNNFSSLLVLAGSNTAEVEGISAAGSTSDSRRYTAVADAEFILKGPTGSKCWPLPPLPAGVSPALISYVASCSLGVKPFVLAAGLHQMPPFPHLRLELPSIGPAACLSTGKAMQFERVQSLWDKGFSMGLKLRKPFLLAECVPGGTTTAQAVLEGLGLSIGDLISGSVRIPPTRIKKQLVESGLSAANLDLAPSSLRLLSAVGDPFQCVAAGLLLGAREAGQEVLLGGGCQMLAVLALALNDVKASFRQEFVQGVVLGTTAWLSEEVRFKGQGESSLVRLMNIVGDHFEVSLMGISTGLRFERSRFNVLRDYERGFIKEGVGAGAFALLAQLYGASCEDIVEACEESLEELQRRALL